MNPVWLVRSRQVMTRFRFWLILSGYDPRDHSIAHKIYLVYASIFWSIWILAVLAMAASGLAGILNSINPGHAVDTAILIEMLGLSGWALFSAYNAARRCPIVFSEDDAYLVCQTPVDRRQVTLAWLLGDWPSSGIPFWVLGSVLGFTLMEVRLNGYATFSNIPDYIFSAILCLSVLVPLHFGLLASIWAFGASRLQGEKEKGGLVWVPVLSGIFIILAWMVRSGLPGLSGLSGLFEFIIQPLLLPVRASLGSANWIAGETIASIWVILGVATLVRLSINFNLSRAAQETSQYEAHRNAVYSLNQDAANEITMKQKLGVQKKPINLPVPDGPGAMFWKDVVQAIRGIRFSAIFIWLQLLAAAAGIFYAQDWGLRLLCLFLWMLFSTHIFSHRLRLDLRNWAIFTQLPFDPLRLVLMEVGLAVIASIFVNWAALWLTGRFLSIMQPVGLAVLIPGISVGMALVTVWDILRQCQTDSLLAGVVPGVDVWSFVVGMIAILIPFGLFAWMVSSGMHSSMPYFGALFANFIILAGLSWLVLNSYRKME